jgi:hypothetical protein
MHGFHAPAELFVAPTLSAFTRLSSIEALEQDHVI